jgi:hypothetical protein
MEDIVEANPNTAYNMDGEGGTTINMDATFDQTNPGGTDGITGDAAMGTYGAQASAQGQLGAGNNPTTPVSIYTTGPETIGASSAMAGSEAGGMFDTLLDNVVSEAERRGLKYTGKVSSVSMAIRVDFDRPG